MTRLSTTLLTLSLCLISLSSVGADVSLVYYNKASVVTGSGNMVTESRYLSNFSRIESNIPAIIEITIGQRQSVAVTFDDNLVAQISTVVIGSTLRIESFGVFETTRQCLIEVTVPALSELSTAGSENVSLDVIEANRLIMNLDGSGTVIASGKINELEINLSGDVDVDSRQLQAQSVLASLDGMGDIQLYAEISFSGQINGWGNITYYGQPAKTSASISGLGEIKPGIN